MTTYAPNPRIDPARWPDVARLPSGLRASIGTAVADRLFRYAVSRLAIRVVMPDGQILGEGRGADAPTMVVHSPGQMMRRIGTDGLIGFGESYQAGEWDSDDLAGVIAEFARGVDELVPTPLRGLRSTFLKRRPAADRPAPENSRTNVERHYDLSNEMFASFLDETMTYSSALFCDDREDLAVAQRRKIDRLLDATSVQQSSRVLEIGSGWAGLAVRAARRGAEVDSITLSVEQRNYGNALLAELGLGQQARVRLCDYRDVQDSFDDVVSVEMIEAVGLEYLDTYFAMIARSLRAGGRAAVQAIVMPHHRVEETREGYTWIHKYIFPGGALPSIELIAASARRAGLQITDDLSMGTSYATTLDRWATRFAEQSHSLDELGFDETFRRMWNFYLRYSEGGFRAGYLDVRQISFTKEPAV